MDEKELSAAFGGQFFNGLFKPVDYPLGAVAPPIDHVPRWHGRSPLPRLETHASTIAPLQPAAEAP